MSEKSREENAKLREEAAKQQAERDLELLVRSTPSEVTAKDALGVERIITTTYGYDAPQVDPDPKEVARLKAAQARLDNAQQERLKQLTDAPDGSAAVAASAIKAESTTSTSSTSTSTSTKAGS